MAHIKKIDFYRVGRKEGCLCDRCGQYIQNIVTVSYEEGAVVRYGQDCFANVYNSGKLSEHGVKLMKKTMKKIERYSKMLEDYKSGKMNPDKDKGWQFQQESVLYGQPSYWYGRDYEDYRVAMIESITRWIAECNEKEVSRFKKINFDI